MERRESYQMPVNLDRIELQEDTIFIKNVCSFSETLNAVEDIFEEKANILPSIHSLILLKPNLNNDLSALTGNSTDLRILVAVLRSLKARGYKRIVIGDGSNVGIDRKDIDVISRLGIDKIAAKYDVKAVNLNRDKSKEVRLNKNHSIRIAQICFDADFILNLPTIKTHAEAQLSCACKNLVGCISGGLEKKKIHYDLFPSLLRLNEIIRPCLHIVDGLIGMEGNGPGDGTPKRFGIIACGTNAFLVDSVISHLTGFDIEEIAYLQLAREAGYLTEKDIKKISSLPRSLPVKKAPPRRFLTKILGHNKLMKSRDITRPLFSNRFVTNMLYRTNIIQDVYEKDNSDITELSVDRRNCPDECDRCREFCPMGIDVTSPDFNFLDDNNCIQCLYCYWICPTAAFTLKGELGYLKRHFQRFKKDVEKLHA